MVKFISKDNNTDKPLGSSWFPERKVGWLEGRRKQKEAKRVADLVASAAWSDNGASSVRLQEAIKLFKNLEPEYKEIALLNVEKTLVEAAKYPFENDKAARQVHVLADFIAAAAPFLPKDASGDPITEPYAQSMQSLAHVTAAQDPDGGHKGQQHVVSACVNALWELGYPSYQFWTKHVLDPVTQDMVITKLLDMPLKEGQDPKTHGWHILAEQLRHIIVPLALNASENKRAFLIHAAKNEDPLIVEAVLRVAVSSQSVPEEMIVMAKERKKNAEDALKEAAEGREGLLANKTGQDANHHTEILSVTSEFLDMLDLRSTVSNGGTQGLEGLDHMLTIYAADQGRRFFYLSPFIRQTYLTAMGDILGDDEAKQLHALNSLSIFDGRHVTVDSIENGVVYALAKRIDNGPEAWNGILVSHLGMLTKPIMLSNASQKTDFLKAMAGKDDPDAVQAAFNAALWLEAKPMFFEIPAGFKQLAQSIIADEGKKALHAIAEDFLDTVRLMELVDNGNGSEFTAASELIAKYRSGKAGLEIVIYRLGKEMVDAIICPDGSTWEEENAKRNVAIDTVLAIIQSGIKVNDPDSALRTIGIEAVKTLHSPAGANDEERAAQKQRASSIIWLLAMNGIAIPGVKVEVTNQR